MSALLKGFIERVLRKASRSLGTHPAKGVFDVKALEGKSAHVVVMLNMPAFVFSRYFFAHGQKSLERCDPAPAGARPTSDGVIGMTKHGNATRKKWLRKPTALGQQRCPKQRAVTLECA